LPDKKFYVYILLSLKDNHFYIGFTSDLKKRLTQHAKGLSTSTRFHRPYKLIHYEYFIDEKDTKTREEFLKSDFERREFKKSLKNTLSLNQFFFKTYF
jgi:putative endonuclease